MLGTQVLGIAAIGGAGVLAGDLVLRGGGDPLLGDAQLGALADRLAGLRVVTGSVVGAQDRVERMLASAR